MALPSDFIKEVLADCPGVSDIAAERAIRKAAIKFCEEALCWRQTFTPTLIDGQQSYTLSVPTDSQIATVMDVHVGPNDVEGLGIDGIRALQPGYLTDQGNPARALSDGFSSVTIYPIPVNSNGSVATIEVALKPTQSAATLPDFLLQHLETIGIGAKALLMLGNGTKPWHNAQLSQVYQAQFDRRCLRKSNSTAFGHMAGSLTVRPRAFG